MLDAAPSSAIDIAGLEHLKRRAAREDPAALAEAAVQFEALFIGLMLKSARDANLGDGILDGEATRQYLELMDQQVALELARKGGFGFGKLIVGELASGEPAAGDAAAAPGNQPSNRELGPLPPRAGAAPLGTFPQRLPESLLELAPTVGTPGKAEHLPSADGAPTGIDRVPSSASAGDAPLGAHEAFVRRLLPEATAAARSLGIDPRLLLAQAALETGWGSAPAAHPDGRPSNNLFGIKAGGDWDGARVVHWTIEHDDGGASAKREAFRAYAGPADSFADYVRLITGSPRYAAALEQASDAEAYARAVGDAGYATDPDYVQKWMSIYRGERLGSALRDVKSASLVPTQ
jgi:peptidoglycan hydrolase FlgJ